MKYQPPLDDKYLNMSDAEALAIIAERKKELGKRLVILGHHYQRDEIVQCADFAGDSLKLSQIAAEQKDAEFIVFCGVHFMAESADILAGENQKVFLPDLTAGCSMADMADIDQVEACWETLKEKLPNPDKLIPITYVNSSAAIKAFCGKHGGTCCTSSNCEAILTDLWEKNPEATLLFLPDQHLGRNTAYRMGVSLEDMPLWDPFEAQGGISDAEFSHARCILWKGFCSVHQEFKLEQIQELRENDPHVNVIVHPECCFDVTQNADMAGSTAYIVNVIKQAEAGSRWAVGTEINLVNRLAGEMAEKGVQVQSLTKTHCLCETMYRINLPHLVWVLDVIADYAKDPENTTLVNQIVVKDYIKKDAVKALERMLAVTS